MTELLAISRSHGKSYRRHGFTLTEMAIVLGIVGLVLAAIWIAAGRAHEASRIKLAMEQVVQIYTNYKAPFAFHGVDIPGATWVDITCMGVNDNFFPGNMTLPTPCIQSTYMGGNYQLSASYGATYPRTPWGGNSFVAVFSHQPNNSIMISYNNIPTDACIALMSHFLGPNTDFQDIFNGSAGVWEGSDPTSWLPPVSNAQPWTVDQIISNCGTAGNDVIQIGFLAR